MNRRYSRPVFPALFLVLAFFSACSSAEPSSIKDFWSYLPDEPAAVFFVQVSRVRGTGYDQELRRKLSATWPGFRLNVDDIDSMMIAKTDQGYSNITIMIRTLTDKSIEDIYKPGIEHIDKKFQDTEYTELRGGFFPDVTIARIDARTFYLYRGEQNIEEFLPKAKAGRSPQLGEEMKRVLDRLSTNDVFLAVAPKNSQFEFSSMRILRANGVLASGDGVTFGGKIPYTGMILLDSDENAGKSSSKYENAIREQEKAARELTGTEGQDAAALLDVMRSLSLSREGTTVNVKGDLGDYEKFRLFLVGNRLPIIGEFRF